VSAPEAAPAAAGGPSARTLSVVATDIVQEYPSPGGGVTRVIDRVSLRFDRPGINMLLGPSGCGKSTLLHMLGGVRPMAVVTPTAGQILIDGVACQGPHDDAVMVFQRYANRPDLTVFDNVAFPFRLKLWQVAWCPKASGGGASPTCSRRSGSPTSRSLRPAQLSGGQNQRVALARALVLRPRILLMDEPFGALDAQTREEMQRLLIELYRSWPCLVIFVTHDVTEALVLGDRVIVLSTQPARIADDFVISEERPRSPAWQRSGEAQALEERILTQLHQASSGKGQVRVTV
jgi:ABC-type nitrate/sulfonate/bicarbonate transport system ATPase subunit